MAAPERSWLQSVVKTVAARRCLQLPMPEDFELAMQMDLLQEGFAIQQPVLEHTPHLELELPPGTATAPGD